MRLRFKEPDPFVVWLCVWGGLLALIAMFVCFIAGTDPSLPATAQHDFNVAGAYCAAVAFVCFVIVIFKGD